MGVQSEYPQHMALLDWLAVEFREQGWSQKQMHRLLVTSATYRQSSKVTADHLAKDPENRLHARAARFRMPSLVLRDVGPRASGLLDLRVGGPAGLSLPARPDLGGPGDHARTGFHLSRLARPRPLPPQPLHVLAAAP